MLTVVSVLVGTGLVPGGGRAYAVQATGLDAGSHRASGVVESGSAAYNYAPTVMKDGTYRMWWCGGIAGDYILYAESDSLDGPFHARGSSSAYQAVLQPTGGSAFDGTHTCDPSVIRVHGTYYLYYGGFDDSTDTTEIGVASSSDGIHWTRLNGGRPIVVPRDPSADGYGAGQPSAAYLNGQFYLMYTDSTGLGGGLQYALRSADPTFQSGVQTATADGFVALTSATKSSFVVSQSYSPDLQYSDALGAWIVLSNQSAGSTYVRFLSPDFSHKVRDDLSIAATWVEGPGLVSRPDKHALPPAASDCSRIALDYVNASTKTSAGNPTGLRHYGQDLRTDTSCAGLGSATVAAVYDGYMIQASGLPATFVTGGKRLQSASFPPLQDLTRNTVDVTSAVFDQIPFGASLHTGATAIGATGKPGAFLLDNNTIWPVNALQLITDNQSSLTTVSVDSYNSHPVGPALYLVQ